MASSSSSSSLLASNHDVFPSFRGKDVRRTFLSHLLNEFQRRRIIAFVDNGINSRSIYPELVRAIRTSRIAIVILSKNYASSSWCLNELLEIIECKVSNGQIVMPIFYDLDPSDVRKQTGYFGKVFKRTCLGKTKDLKLRWKQALTDVANILGEHSKNWHSEAAMIKKIATDVSNELNSTPSKDFDNFVGIEAHIEKMNSLLCLGTDEVKMIGIWGPAGIGKSTIARALYNRLSSNFQLTLFMENVKGSYGSNESYSSKLRLQERFLSELFNDKDLRIKNLAVAEKRLSYRKVLVVLDDVDKIAQLNALADRPQWFGEGSRIIVTTEYKDILEAHDINHIYEVGFPSRLEALQIFSQSAFRQDSPPDGYVELANEVAKLTGLPLGLSVLGSSLRGKSKSKWIRALPSLKATLHEDIEKILRIGYDSLGDNDNLKAIFLYIACLFNGDTKDRVTGLLGNSDLHIESGLDVLVERALIYISSDKRIIMHHLLQQMGHQIVHRQSIHEPGKRQFLMDAKKINDVLADNTGSGTILGISFNMSEIEELFLGKGAFTGMHNLQILRFYKKWSDKARLYLDEGLDSLTLPRNLRLLHWEACPMKCMPCWFSAKFLVEINMQESKLEKLWQGGPMLACLKKINLCGSINLEELPDLSKAPNLERLELTRCRSLVTLPSSIGELSKLNFLHLGECTNLEFFPANFALESLSFLNICECSKLKTFPEISTKIKRLSASFTAIRKVPQSVRHWGYLKTLTMICCGKVTKFPQLPVTISKLYLDYSGITEIPDWIKNLSGLKILSMTYCEQLLDISPDICKLKCLQKLDFTGCINIRKFPVEIFQSFKFKHELFLRLDNVQAKSLPADIPEKTHCFPLKLFMSDNDFTSIPDSIKHLSYLHSLHLHHCMKLVSLPELPDSLSELHAENCESLESISQPSSSFHNPKLVLKFINCLKLDREARKLLIEEWACGYAVLPGGEVPEYFSHQARGNSLSIDLDHVHLSGSLRFKACVVLPAGDWPKDVPASCIEISCRLRGKHFTSVYKWPYIDLSYTFEKDHLFILNSYFTLEEDNIPEGKLRFDFRCLPCKILRCGVQFLEACPCKYDSVAHPSLSYLPLQDDESKISNSVADMEYESSEEAGEIDLETRRSKKRERPSSSEEPERINKKLRVSGMMAARKLEKYIQRQGKARKKSGQWNQRRYTRK